MRHCVLTLLSWLRLFFFKPTSFSRHAGRFGPSYEPSTHVLISGKANTGFCSIHTAVDAPPATEQIILHRHPSLR